MVQSVRELIEWPRQASDDWCKGFLAGIFDAEGSYGDSLRIHNTDSAIVDWTTWCLRRLGFMFVVEDRGLSNGMRSVRLLGGLVQQLRFLQTVDVAITRKRSLEGKAVKTNARLGVVFDRAAWASNYRYTTSPQAPATSSPMESSATTASLAPPTPTLASTPAGTSSARSS